MLNEGNEISLAATVGDNHLASPGFGLNRHEQVHGASSNVLVVLLA
jgi:hypothetical protein